MTLPLVCLSSVLASADSPSRSAREAYASEQTTRSEPSPWVILRACPTFEFLIPELSPILSDGLYYAPLGEARVAAVSAQDLIDCSAAELANWRGQTLTLSGPHSLSGQDIASALGELVKFPVEYVPVSIQAEGDRLLRARRSLADIEDTLAIWDLLRGGRACTVHDGVERALGRPPEPLDEALRGLVFSR